MINGMHAIVFSPEAEKVRDFFADVIGLSSVDAGGGWLIFALPPAELAVHPGDGESRHQLYLMCDDIGATLAELRGKGVEVAQEVSDQRWGLVAAIRLPDGTEFPIYQPQHVTMLRADVREHQTVRDEISGRDFDAVVDWVAFTPGQVRTDIDLFRGRTGQYVFISSASAYQTPPARMPVTESTPLRNPFWQYSRDKIACEDLLVTAYREEGFPATIVRPSHTYDATSVPFDGGWTVLGRMRAGKPVIVHGDGTSLWTLTHHDDFARAFVPLLGHPRTLGEAIHITSDDVLTWNQIAGSLAAALGVTPRLVHVPSDAIAAADPDWGAGLLGDKAHSMVFDNAKLRSIVPGWRAVIPFEQGAREIVEWYLADPARQVTDAALDAVMDKLAAAWTV
jgi:nucleoside-diphosphate-sugar epimerase